MNEIKQELKKLEKAIKKGNDYLYEQWYKDNAESLLLHFDQHPEMDMTYGEFCHSAYDTYVKIET